MTQSDENIEQWSDRRLIALFAKSRDDRAFGILVERHGPLVMNVCRRVLRNQHDAEEAFQAVFLVLAKKAARVRWRDSIANWLYGVAYRISLKAAAANQKRRERERTKMEMNKENDLQQVADYDAQLALDEEVNRLPGRYRAVIVLCCFEGKTNQEAAAEIGCSAAAVKGRLQRARELLRMRLTLKGLVLSAVLLAVQTPAQAAAAVVSETLLSSTAQAAVSFASGKVAGGVLAHGAVQLAKGEIGMMLSAMKLKIAASFLLLVGVVGLGVMFVAQQLFVGEESISPIVVSQGVDDSVAQTAPEITLVTFAEDKESDEKKIQGTWEVVSGQQNGELIPEERIKGLTYEFFEGDVEAKKKDVVGVNNNKYTLDSSTTPKSIDILDGNNISKGIYKFEKGLLVICFTPSVGEKRTKEFSTDAANDTILFKMKKVDPKKK